jgi:MoaA/NifB/PqqE/SkfB family radical SAM enzyme
VKSNVGSKIITGWKARLIRFRITVHILRCAAEESGSLVRGLNLVKKIRNNRTRFKGVKDNIKFVHEDGRYFISENFPGWPSSAFTGFIRGEIRRILSPGSEKNLTTVIFAITSKCRLGCRHCYEWNNISVNDKLSYPELATILHKLKATGVSHIQLSGGEPLERFDDLLKIISEAGKDCETWILTSGFGLTFDKAVQLKNAGLTGADISLDSWDEKEHNNTRNNHESFFWAGEAVRNCRKAGLLTSLSLCAANTFVSQTNLVNYAELAREWNVGIIRLLDPREAGRFKGKNIELSEMQTEILETFYLNMVTRKEYSDYPIVTYPGYHQRRSGCGGAGDRYIYIDSAGEIHACPFCQRSAGNALDTGIEEAIDILLDFGCHKFDMSINRLQRSVS